MNDFAKNCMEQQREKQHQKAIKTGRIAGFLKICFFTDCMAAQLVTVLSHTSKVYGFDSWSGHLQKAANQLFSLTSMFLYISLFLSFFIKNQLKHILADWPRLIGSVIKTACRPKDLGFHSQSRAFASIAGSSAPEGGYVMAASGCVSCQCFSPPTPFLSLSIETNGKKMSMDEDFFNLLEDFSKLLM